MRHDKWRVHRTVVSVPRPAAIVRPAALLRNLEPLREDVAVWGIYPPGWHFGGAPLLIFPTHAQAFRAALDRADFAVVPSMLQPPANWGGL